MTGGYLDDPNRNAVGLEPAWAEGSGGSDTSAGGGPPSDPQAEPDAEPEPKAEPKPAPKTAAKGKSR